MVPTGATDFAAPPASPVLIPEISKLRLLIMFNLLASPGNDPAAGPIMARGFERPSTRDLTFVRKPHLMTRWMRLCSELLFLIYQQL
jgi:hypothetical protein